MSHRQKWERGERENCTLPSRSYKISTKSAWEKENDAKEERGVERKRKREKRKEVEGEEEEII